MELVISARVQGIFESYNIFVDDEKVAKVRGNNKKTTIRVEEGSHTLQIKGLNGKSSIVKIEGKNGDRIELNFITHFFKAGSEGYFELVED